MSKRLNRDDIDKFHDCGLYLPTRTIYMSSEQFFDDGAEGGCDSLMVERFIKNIHILAAVSAEPINIIMNNIGGDKYHGFAIYDAIKTCPNFVTVKVFGHAMSMGSIILQAADERLMAPTSRQMIHYGTWGVDDHAKTIQKHAQESLKIDKWMEKMYLDRIQEKNPNLTMDEVKELLNHDTYYTASESVAMGLADKVISFEGEDE